MELKNYIDNSCDTQYLAIGELKAETLINTLQLKCDNVKVSNKGTFYSNYCEDILAATIADSEVTELALSRDGIFHLLPEALFFHENCFRETHNDKGKTEELLNEKKRIYNFFAPFDTEFFKIGLFLDSTTYNLEKNAVNIILKDLYGLDRNSIQNPFVKKIAPLILHAAEIRGKFPLLERIFSIVTTYPVKIIRERIVRLIFNIPGLTKNEYDELYQSTGEFTDFCSEWFLPAGQQVEHSVKDASQQNLIFDDMRTIILDYNTYI